MANNFFPPLLHKRTSVSGKIPNTSIIAAGEISINMADGILYSTNGLNVFPVGANNVNINVSNTIVVNSCFVANSTGTFHSSNVSAPIFKGVLTLPSYTSNNLPSASVLGAGSMIYLSDDPLGGLILYSDGNNFIKASPISSKIIPSGWDATVIGPNWSVSQGGALATYTNSSAWSTVRGAKGRTGANYFEMTISSRTGNYILFGLMDATSGSAGLAAYNPPNCVGINITAPGINVSTGTGWSTTVSGLTCVAGDVVGIAYDTSIGKFWYTKNGQYLTAEINPVAGGTAPAAGNSAGAHGSFPVGTTIYAFVACPYSTTCALKIATATSQFAYAPPPGFTPHG